MDGRDEYINVNDMRETSIAPTDGSDSERNSDEGKLISRICFGLAGTQLLK